MTGALPGNTPRALSRADPTGDTNHMSQGAIPCRQRHRIGMGNSHGRRAVGALLRRCLPRLGSGRATRLQSLAQAHRTVMLAQPPATGRQARVRAPSCRQRGRKEGQAEHSQQQDGNKSAQ